jgi:hypothetical protein
MYLLPLKTVYLFNKKCSEQPAYAFLLRFTRMLSTTAGNEECILYNYTPAGSLSSID